MRLRTCWVWFLVSIGCATPRLGSGKVRWRALETEHFKLHTDLPLEQAEQRADELERVLHAFQHSAFQTKGKLPLKLNVIMFRDQEAFDDFGRGEADGYLLDDVLYEPWVVMPAPTANTGLRVLNHELTHFVAFAAMPRQPPWFAEGLASYFETARFDREGTHFIVGKPSLLYHDVLRSLRLVPPSELIGKSDFKLDEQYYASAWVLVHYLLSQRDEQFVAYQTGLAKGVGYARSYEQAFAGLTLEQMDGQVQAYFRDGLYESVSFPLAQLPRAPMKVRELSVADEYAISGLLWANCSRCSATERARAGESYRLALANDPMQLQVQSLNIAEMTDAQAALQAAQKLTEAHPQHWLAWITLGFVANNLLDSPAAEALADRAAERALALAPTQAHAWLLRAYRDAAHGERAAALHAADRAQRLQRSAPNVLLGRATLLAHLGECDALAELTARIREQPELAIEPSTLERMEQTCAKPR
jgi:hypothetical protein